VDVWFGQVGEMGENFFRGKREKKKKEKKRKFKGKKEKQTKKSLVAFLYGASIEQSASDEFLLIRIFS
jgi:hypothetical protein